MKMDERRDSSSIPNGIPQRSPGPGSSTGSGGHNDASINGTSSIPRSSVAESTTISHGSDRSSERSDQKTLTATRSEEEEDDEIQEAHVKFDEISLTGTIVSDAGSQGSDPPPSSERARRTGGFHTTCFKDNVRQIDFVLCYVVQDAKNKKDSKKEFVNAAYRQRFEESLQNQGLELEYEDPAHSLDGKTGFVKIHAPFAILERMAEMQGMQKPFIESDIAPDQPSWWKRIWQKMCRKDPFTLQPEYQLPRKEYFTDGFERERRKDFLNSDDELTFFSATERIYLVWDALSHTTVKQLETNESPQKTQMSKNGPVKNGHGPKPIPTVVENGHQDQGSQKSEVEGEEEGEDEAPLPATEEHLDAEIEDEEDSDDILENDKALSFQFLLQTGIYTAGFPLHDDSMESGAKTEEAPIEEWSMRRYLYESWARPRQWRRYQPIHEVRKYYGEKVGLYFAWIGLYTQMLIAPSIVGLLVTIYGVISIPYEDTTAAICEDKTISSKVLCPDCPTEACKYTQVGDYCTMSKIAVAFDNDLTVFFSVFMALWAVWYLETWKRYRAQLCVDWDVSDEEFSEENLRPEYVLRVPDKKLNPVTLKMEPHLKGSTKLKRLAASLGTVLFFIFVVIGLLAGIMIYKVVGSTWWRAILGDTDAGNKSEMGTYSLIVSITSSVTNGIFIAIMTNVYMKVAWALTQAEFPKTDKDFENSYTYKVFTFQCVNFYGALFYLAILRGRVSRPPHEQMNETRCPISGCMVDVTIQLAIIMIGKQAINNFLELGKPMIRSFINKMKIKRHSKADGEDLEKVLPRWQQDLQLGENHRIPLFDDYLEILIQYGFLTMFGVAFPLAPLFALLNNIIEIRLDAYKNLMLTKRCVPLKAKNLGPWRHILTIVTKVAVITNALIIAFTTTFIDRAVYHVLGEGADWRQDNNVTNGISTHLNFMLSTFNTSDWHHDQKVVFGNATVPDPSTGNETRVDQCYYVDYRFGPGHDEPYERTAVWWHMLAAKLIFVILFEHFAILFQMILAKCIADVPKREKLRMAREKYLTQVNFLNREFGKSGTGFVSAYDSEDEESPQEYAPDELPEWVTTGHPPGAADTLRSQVPNGEPHSENGSTIKARRGKYVVRGPVKQKRPLLMMLFRKLMMCGD